VSWPVFTAFILAVFVFGSYANAQESSDFSSDNCPEKTAARWCPPLLSKEGWKLRYKTESPQDLADAYWRYEIWMRGPAAVVCIFEGDRAGIRVDGCRTLHEVER
jgi:hypothetical protein